MKTLIAALKVLAGSRETKNWRGKQVDVELKEEWLESLNDLPYVEIESTCSGHPKVEHRPGESETPNVWVIAEGPTNNRFDKTIKKISKALKTVPNTTVETTKRRSGEKAIRGFNIFSTIKKLSGENETEIDKWWDEIIKALQTEVQKLEEFNTGKLEAALKVLAKTTKEDLIAKAVDVVEKSPLSKKSKRIRSGR